MRKWIDLLEGMQNFICEDVHQDLISVIKSAENGDALGDDEETHIGYHAHLRSDVPLPASTWLIHWTDSSTSIAQQGFAKGQSDPSVMGVTKGTVYAKEPGYNFAYLAGSKDAKKGFGVYGHEALMFRAAGVHIYHGGDDEEQVVFWGPDVKPANMILIVPDMTTPYWYDEATSWHAFTTGVKFHDGPGETSIPDRAPLAKGSFAKVVRWVMNNA